MKRLIKYTTVLLLMLCCCNPVSKKPDNIKVITVDIDNFDDVSIFDIFEKVEVVPLETDESCLIRNINKFIYYNNIFYIFDFQERKILAFDHNGKFKFEIDDRGQGPQEYLYLADFDINKEKNTLSLLDAMKAEINEYSLDGNFLNKHKIPQLVNSAYKSIKHITDDTIAFWTYDYSNRLKFYSKEKNKIFKECFPTDDSFFDNFSGEAFAYDYYIRINIDNNVYEILPEGDVTVAYTWDLGKLNYDHNKIKKPNYSNDPEEFEKFKEKLYASEVANYIFTSLGGNSRYIYSNVLRKNKNIKILHNKVTNKTVAFKETTEGADFWPKYWTDSLVIGFFIDSPHRFVPDNVLDEENIRIRNQFREDDNPVLVKYYLKK